MAEPLLTIRDLITCFQTPRGPVRAVDGLSLRLPRRTTIGIVGESGCGKSAAALSILRLIRMPGQVASGQVLYHPAGGGAPMDLRTLPEEDLRELRGDRIAMIFQEPMTSLNPVYTAGEQVGEALRAHRSASRREARAEALRLFRQVGIADAERRLDEYPHQLSGGMRQRVMIAMALCCRPDLLIADEPTTALDVTIQAQILDLLGQLQAELGMSMLLITHDLGIVAQTCAQVIVMYAGQVVEQATSESLFRAPRHPYTAGLLRSLPQLSDAAQGKQTRLAEIPGMVPRLDELPAGCRFQDRCPRVTARCREEAPLLRPLPDGMDEERLVRCHLPLADAPAGAAA